MEAKFQTSLAVISVIPVKVHRQNRVLNQNTMILNFQGVGSKLKIWFGFNFSIFKWYF